MKNKIIFLSLALISFSAHPYTQGVDPDTWNSEPADDEFDPNAKSIIGELTAAAKRRLTSSTTTKSSPTTSTQTSDSNPKNEKNNAQKANEERTQTLNSWLSDTNSHLQTAENNLNQQRYSKTVNRGIEVLGGVVIIGAVAVYHVVEDGVSTLGTIAAGVGGLGLILWNEASARSKSKHIQALEKQKVTLEKNKQDIENELNPKEQE